MREFAVVSEKAARSAGALLRNKQGKVSANEKGPADLVTEADYAAQEIIQEVLLTAFPDHCFVGEEDTLANENGLDDQAEFRWVVDPLDGTTNYVHGLEHYCVSIALMRSTEICVGTVYDPVRDELFQAVSGGGAFLNGRTIKTSNVRKLDRALVASGFGTRVKCGSEEVTRFLNVLFASQSIRRLGSAALNLCYVASGRLDAYWATSVKSWDVAAGILLLREAGGIATDLSGGAIDTFDPALAASATEELQQELLEVLHRSTLTTS